MAKETTSAVNTEDEWEVVNAGMGEQWNFDKGPMIGYIIGKFPMDLPERSWTINPDGTNRTIADYWKFATRDTGEEVFIWDSYNLSEALTDPGAGDLVRIVYKGERSFDNGNKRVKEYEVSVRKQ